MEKTTKNMGKTTMKIIVWAAGFYLVWALLSCIAGDEIHWVGLVFQSLAASLVCHGLEWIYKKKFGTK